MQKPSSQPHDFRLLSSYPDVTKWGRLEAPAIDWFTSHGVPASAIDGPEPVRIIHGSRGNDGRFEVGKDGERWLALPQLEDVVFWQPRTGSIATWNNRCFALNEQIIDDAATFSLGYRLAIFETPLAWLQAGRDGIVVIDWSQAFDRLRNAPRIALQPGIATLYRKHMKPRRLPDVEIIIEKEQQLAG